jgi:hypothetical protein
MGCPVVAVAVAAAAANSLESQEGDWPAIRVEGNIGRSTFGSHWRQFVIGWGGPFGSEGERLVQCGNRKSTADALEGYIGFA